jgi:hypothetical protein
MAGRRGRGKEGEKIDDPGMFLGHYGVAFALKRAEPKLSLGTLFVAVQLADLLWGGLLLLGWEHVRIAPETSPVTPLEFIDYPISHSLLGALIWSAVAAALYFSWPTRDTTRHLQSAVMVGVAVFSHFPLDVLAHVPDLTLAGRDTPRLGLGLWNHPTATIVVELLFLATGVTVYVALRSHRHPVRPVRLAILVLLLVGVYFASLYGPLPPSVTTIAVGDIVFVLGAAAMAAWVDLRATPDELAAQGRLRR